MAEPPIKSRLQSRDLTNHPKPIQDRLNNCLQFDPSHITPGQKGGHVTVIQRALATIRQRMPELGLPEITDKEGDYGTDTTATVLKYKSINGIVRSGQPLDAIVGRMTLTRLDDDLLRPAPTPPTPPAPRPLGFDEAQQKIRAYLAREAKRNVGDILLNHEANLLVFGEVHFTFDPMKAFLFHELAGRVRIRRPIVTHFHASERFLNNQQTRAQISAFLQAAPLQMAGLINGLSPELRPFVPVLAAANSFPERRYGVLPSDSAPGADEDQRHEAIFNAFNDAARRCPDVPPRSITSAVSRGNILLGGRHAARRSIVGSAADTTCARLVKAGWNVHAIRLTTPFIPGATFITEDLNLRLLGSSDERIINGLAIVEQIAAGRSFYADLRKPDSPFRQLKDEDSKKHEIPFTDLFDAIVHLGPQASL
jgi:hypothetical protein